MWASHCGGFSCCGAQAPGTQASVADAHGVSSSLAHGVFPDQGLNPCPLDWQWIPVPPGEVLRAFKYHRVNKEFISNHSLYRPISM